MTLSCKRQRAAWPLKSRSSLLSSRSRVKSDCIKLNRGEMCLRLRHYGLVLKLVGFVSLDRTTPNHVCNAILRKFLLALS